MIILPVKNNIMNSMTYVLSSENIDYCILIDCGEYGTLKPVLKQIGKKVKAVLLTHGHSDHIFGLKGLLETDHDIVIYTNKEGHNELSDSKKNLSFYHERPFIIDKYIPYIIQDKDVLYFKGFPEIEVIATPGHSSSCMSYKIDNNLFSGDAYIPNVKVFSGFPGGNKELAIESYSLLDDMNKQGYNIYCGHHSYDVK